MIYANGIIQKSVRVQVQGIKKLTGTLTEYLLLLKPIKAMQIGSVLKQMLNKETNQINKGTVVAIEGDFSPNSIALLLALIEKACIIVPLTNTSNRNENKLFNIAQVEFIFRIDE